MLTTENNVTASWNPSEALGATRLFLAEVRSSVRKAGVLALREARAVSAGPEIRVAFGLALLFALGLGASALLGLGLGVGVINP